MSGPNIPVIGVSSSMGRNVTESTQTENRIQQKQLEIKLYEDFLRNYIENYPEPSIIAERDYSALGKIFFEIGSKIWFVNGKWKLKELCDFILNTNPQMVLPEFLEHCEEIPLTPKSLILMFYKGSGTRTEFLDKIITAISNGDLPTDQHIGKILSEFIDYESSKAQQREDLIVALLEGFSTKEEALKCIDQLTKNWDKKDRTRTKYRILTSPTFWDLSGDIFDEASKTKWEPESKNRCIHFVLNILDEVGSRIRALKLLSSLISTWNHEEQILTINKMLRNEHFFHLNVSENIGDRSIYEIFPYLSGKLNIPDFKLLLQAYEEEVNFGLHIDSESETEEEDVENEKNQQQRSNRQISSGMNQSIYGNDQYFNSNRSDILKEAQILKRDEVEAEKENEEIVEGELEEGEEKEEGEEEDNDDIALANEYNMESVIPSFRSLVDESIDDSEFMKSMKKEDISLYDSTMIGFKPIEDFLADDYSFIKSETETETESDVEEEEEDEEETQLKRKRDEDERGNKKIKTEF